MTDHESQFDPESDTPDGPVEPTGPDAQKAPTASAALASDLSDLFGHAVDTTSLDGSILASAKAHFAECDTPVSAPAPIRAWWARWRIAEVAGLAAAIGLIVWISSPGHHGDQSPNGKNIAVVGDVDRNGKVDILDAYLLQRNINAGDALQTDWDMTGDGQVNRDDVSAVAMLAVKLDGGKSL